MPLGKLSKTQIAKGFEALEEIQAAVEGLYRNGFLRGLNAVLRNNDTCMAYQWQSTKVSFGF